MKKNIFKIILLFFVTIFVIIGSIAFVNADEEFIEITYLCEDNSCKLVLTNESTCKIVSMADENVFYELEYQKNNDVYLLKKDDKTLVLIVDPVANTFKQCYFEDFIKNQIDNGINLDSITGIIVALVVAFLGTSLGGLIIKFAINKATSAIKERVEEAKKTNDITEKQANLIYKKVDEMEASINSYLEKTAEMESKIDELNAIMEYTKGVSKKIGEFYEEEKE